VRLFFFPERDIMRAMGYLLMLCIIALAMHDLALFVDIPSLGVVAVLMAWSLLVVAAGPGTGRAFKSAFGRVDTTTTGDLQTSIRVLRTVRFSALVGGIVAVGAGLIRILGHMDVPSEIGPGMAMLLLGLFYAVFFAYVILLPLQGGVERRLAATGGDMPSTEISLDLVVLAGGLVFPPVAFALLAR